jgi:hypothetical protein
LELASRESGLEGVRARLVLAASVHTRSPYPEACCQ